MLDIVTEVLHLNLPRFPTSVFHIISGERMSMPKKMVSLVKLALRYLTDASVKLLETVAAKLWLAVATLKDLISAEASPYEQPKKVWKQTDITRRYMLMDGKFIIVYSEYM